ncbi:MAG: PAS domain S-box protein, partial [Desulfobacteraceae bacterium]|nr:PAS domain S-box protein [Desulfobacteraceae bacterium]
MKLTNKIKEIWNSVETYGLPLYAWESDPLSLWRERIFFIILILLIAFGSVILFPIMLVSYSEGQLIVTGLASSAWFSVVFVLYFRNLPIVYRTWILFIAFYLIGIAYLHLFGLNSAGHIWFFRASVIVGIMLGMRAAIAALFINLIIVLSVAVIIITDSSALVSQDVNALKLWLTVMANFLISNTIITLVIVLMLEGVDKILFNSQEAVNTLRESEAKLKGIFEANPDPIVVYNVDGHPQYLNSAFVEVFGWTMEDLAGKPIPFVPTDQL